MNNSQKFLKSIQRGYTLIEVAAVVGITVALGTVMFRGMGAQAAIATSKATQIYQISATMANNWKRLSEAAGVPYNLGANYWASSNPMLACATSSCASTGNNAVDGQRAIRVLAEGQSAMNPAYAAAWTKAHLTPMTGLQNISGFYVLKGSLTPTTNVWPTLWGSGYKGAEFWAMGPIMVYYQGVPEDVAVEIARKYANIDITSASQTQTSGPVHFWIADSGGPGYRAVGLEFP